MENNQENMNFLNNIINSIADPIFVKDDKYCFVIANNALCDILGMKKEDIIGKTLGESLPSDQMEHFLSVDKMVLESGVENTSEELLTGKDGKILTIITKKTRFIDEQGKKFLIGVIHDISEIKNMRDNLNDKIADLEKINKVMIGRELDMAKLKKELEDLKSK